MVVYCPWRSDTHSRLLYDHNTIQCKGRSSGIHCFVRIFGTCNSPIGKVHTYLYKNTLHQTRSEPKTQWTGTLLRVSSRRKIKGHSAGTAILPYLLWWYVYGTHNNFLDGTHGTRLFRFNRKFTPLEGLDEKFHDCDDTSLRSIKIVTARVMK